MKIDRPYTRVFIIGPITNPDPMALLRNIQAGLVMTARLYDAGFAPFPLWCDFTAVMQTRTATANDIKDASLAWLRCCEVVLVLPGWESSAGAQAEHSLADQLGVPVVYSFEDLVMLRTNQEEYAAGKTGQGAVK